MGKKSLEQMIRLTVHRYCADKYTIEDEKITEKVPTGISKDELLQIVLDRSNDSATTESVTTKQTSQKINIFPILRQCATVLITVAAITGAALCIQQEIKTHAGLNCEHQCRTEIYEENAEVQVDNEHGFESYPSNYQWTCGYVPEGYELVEEKVIRNVFGWFEYRNKTGERLVFTYRSKNYSQGYTMDLLMVDGEKKNLIEDEYGTFVIRQDKSGCSLYWEKEGFAFTIAGSNLEKCIELKEKIH